MVCANYEPRYGPAVDADALTETKVGTPYNYRYGANFDDLFIVGQYDFFEPAGRELYGDALLEAVGDGYDGWMEDFGEYTPLDSVSNETIDGTRAHNEYAREYHCAAWDAIKDLDRPIVRFQRSGWTGAAKCAQVVWGGDPTTGFGFRRAPLRRDPGAQRRDLRHRHLGLGHRRLLRARRKRRSPRSS